MTIQSTSNDPSPSSGDPVEAPPVEPLRPFPFYMLFHCLETERNEGDTVDDDTAEVCIESSTAVIDDRGKHAYRAYMAFNHLSNSMDSGEFVREVFVAKGLQNSSLLKFLRDRPTDDLDTLSRLRRLYDETPITLIKAFFHSFHFWMPTGVQSMLQDCCYGIHSVVKYYMTCAIDEQCTPLTELSTFCAQVFMAFETSAYIPEELLASIDDARLDEWQRLFCETVRLQGALVGLSICHQDGCLRHLTESLLQRDVVPGRPLFSRHFQSLVGTRFVSQVIRDVMFLSNKPSYRFVDPEFITTIVRPWVAAALQRIRNIDDCFTFPEQKVAGAEYFFLSGTKRWGCVKEECRAEVEDLCDDFATLRRCLMYLKSRLAPEAAIELFGKVDKPKCQQLLQCRVSADARFVGALLLLFKEAAFTVIPLLVEAGVKTRVAEYSDACCDVHVLEAASSFLTNSEVNFASTTLLDRVVAPLFSALLAQNPAVIQVANYVYPIEAVQQRFRTAVHCALEAIDDGVCKHWKESVQEIANVISPIVSLCHTAGGTVGAISVAILCDIVKVSTCEALAQQGAYAIDAFHLVVDSRHQRVATMSNEILENSSCHPLTVPYFHRELQTYGTSLYGYSLLAGKIADLTSAAPQSTTLTAETIVTELRDLATELLEVGNRLTQQSQALSNDEAATFTFSGAKEIAMYVFTRLLMFFSKSHSKVVRCVHGKLYDEMPLLSDVTIIGVSAIERAVALIAFRGSPHRKLASSNSEKQFLLRCKQSLSNRIFQTEAFAATFPAALEIYNLRL